VRDIRDIVNIFLRLLSGTGVIGIITLFGAFLLDWLNAFWFVIWTIIAVIVAVSPWFIWWRTRSPRGIGALYPGVLSTGVKPPQVPYKGNALTATELYCRVTIAPYGQDLMIEIRRNGTPLGTVTIAAGAQTGTTPVSQTISDGDYFDINITQVGTSPNEGSDLVWLVVPG